MKITWYGHACFKLESRDGSLVLDPYSDGSVPGMKLPAISADAVHCSHGHDDHNAAALVSLSGGRCAMPLTDIPSFHDEVGGAKRGDNLICLIQTEGKRIVHLGDLGHEPDDACRKSLGSIDILMIPVGGVYTVDAQTAKRICERLSPGIVIPMHYRCESAGLQNVAPVDDFLRLFPNESIVRLDSRTLDPDALPAGRVAVFPW